MKNYFSRLTFSQFIEIICYFIVGLFISVKFYYILNIIHEHHYSDLNAKEIIQLNRYSLETHKVITEDGYWLTLYRIPNVNTDAKIKKKYPVLFVHGIFSNANEFVALGANDSLPFMLSDAGFDVWLANLRGSTFSPKHSSFDLYKDSEKFWKYSLDEVARYDIPEIMDYILGVSEQDKLHYIGHSTGSIILFMMLSEKPEYNDKLHHITALSPAIFGQKQTPLFNYIKTFRILNLLELFGIYYVQSPQFILNLFCSEVSLFSKICLNQLSKTMEFNQELINEDMVSVLINTLPSKVSINQFKHYLQILSSDGFYRFANQSPSKYDLSKTKIPVSIYSENKHSRKLLKMLSNVVNYRLVEDENFRPINFVFSNNITSLVFSSLLKDVNKCYL